MIIISAVRPLPLPAAPPQAGFTTSAPVAGVFHHLSLGAHRTGRLILECLSLSWVAPPPRKKAPVAADLSRWPQTWRQGPSPVLRARTPFYSFHAAKVVIDLPWSLVYSHSIARGTRHLNMLKAIADRALQHMSAPGPLTARRSGLATQLPHRGGPVRSTSLEPTALPWPRDVKNRFTLRFAFDRINEQREADGTRA